VARALFGGVAGPAPALGGVAGPEPEERGVAGPEPAESAELAAGMSVTTSAPTSGIAPMTVSQGNELIAI
jgi:hypothetical protein